jgi:glycosyltransferase involved in cell wall biosynthesis
MPRISAAITTFNRAAYLSRAIGSVLNQTFSDFELLILDNSSADGTEDVVRAAGDPRIRYIRHPECNISQSRNIGVRDARGEFLAFLDDDDEWLPDKLERQVARFEESDAELGLVYGGFQRFDDRGHTFETHRPVLRGKVLISLLWQKDAFTGSASNPMLRLSAVRALGGFDENVPTSEDWEFYLRLAEYYNTEYIPDIVVRIRHHSGSRLADRIDDARRLEERVVQRYGRLMDSRLRSFYLRKIGGKLCRTGRPAEGRQRLLQAIRLDPLNVLGYGQFGLSFLSAGAYQKLHVWYRRLAGATATGRAVKTGPMDR